jgi:hypothetical protein
MMGSRAKFTGRVSLGPPGAIEVGELQMVMPDTQQTVAVRPVLAASMVTQEQAFSDPVIPVEDKVEVPE